MQYTVKDAQGNDVAGDDKLDAEMTAEADRVKGTIVNQNGDVVYRSVSE